jgi:hypothetical protein
MLLREGLLMCEPPTVVRVLLSRLNPDPPLFIELRGTLMLPRSLRLKFPSWRPRLL